MKINRTFWGGVAAVALLLSWSGVNAFAAQITISGNGDYRAGNGGEFNIRAYDAGGETLLAPNLGVYTTVNGTTVGTADGTRMNAGYNGQIGFETFCIEVNQFIAFVPGHYDATISLGAKPGGAGGGSGGIDLISIGTGYLYSRFASGALAADGYVYASGGSRAASAVMLQKAIWFMEDEITLAAAGGGGNIFLNALNAQYGSLAAAHADNNVFKVAALNLGGPPGYANQDQLILHDNGFHVPDGGMTVMLLGMALTGLGLMRRKLA